MVSVTFLLRVESRMVLIVPLVVYSSSSRVLVKMLPFLRTAPSSARRMLANIDECWVISSVAWRSQDTFVISYAIVVKTSLAKRFDLITAAVAGGRGGAFPGKAGYKETIYETVNAR
jgi:hypothetical protein